MPIRKVFRTPESFGPLKLRLQRFGRRNEAFFNIVVAQSRFRRNGKHHGILGTYYPHPIKNPNPSQEGDSKYKLITLDIEKIQEWLSKGVECTSIVHKLLSKAGLLPSQPRHIEKAESFNKKMNAQLDQ